MTKKGINFGDAARHVVFPESLPRWVHVTPRGTAQVTALLTTVTLVAFAANSLLCRMALAPGWVDPVSFTAIRLTSGAAALVVFSSLVSEKRAARESVGSWPSSVSLFIYAIGFSLAYVSLETGVGALILFGSVQATMIGGGLFGGERPRPGEWLGLLVAMGGLTCLVRPGMTAPDPWGVLLMVASGVGWGVYSLRGRRRVAPIASTTGNFLRAVPLGLLALAFAWPDLHVERRGVLLALTSGILTSGLGYVLWYVALRGLTATRAAIVQLTVPVIAAVGGVAFLSEEVTIRLGVSSSLILGGVAVAILAKRARRSCADATDR